MMGQGKGLDPEDPHWLGEGISVYLDQGMVVLAEEREGRACEEFIFMMTK
jgi:hypothetical protein